MLNIYISPQEDSTDTEKRDILDLLKLSYIVVRTGIGTGQIMVNIVFIYIEDDLDCMFCRMCPGQPTTSGPLSGRVSSRVLSWVMTMFLVGSLLEFHESEARLFN